MWHFDEVLVTWPVTLNTKPATGSVHNHELGNPAWLQQLPVNHKQDRSEPTNWTLH